MNELDVYVDRVLEKYIGKQKKNLSLKVEKSLLVAVLNPSLISEKLLDKIFYAYASPDEQLVELRQFFAGLSTCCDGSTDDKLIYCFKLFDLDKDGNLSFEELTLMLETIYKISEIHSKLIKSSSTMLTLSRAPTTQENTRRMEQMGESEHSASMKHFNVSTAALFLPSIQEQKSMTSVQGSHISKSEYQKSSENVVDRAETHSSKDTKRIHGTSSEHQKSTEGVDALSSENAVDATSIRSKRLSIKGLPMFENINRMLKSHSTDICREDLLVRNTNFYFLIFCRRLLQSQLDRSRPSTDQAKHRMNQSVNHSIKISQP